MADLFDPSSSCSPPPPPSPSQTTRNFALETDDISSFLHTLLSSSQTSTSSNYMICQSPPPVMLESRRTMPGSAAFSLLDPNSGLNFPFSGSYNESASGDRAHNVFSGSIGGSIVGVDEAEGESEEHEELPTNPAPGRSSSKRSRAAEVHNLSEKRRRQRINEKMKALQKLIPNSNKTDKASMLDEAIEYLKQLQLQVQMLTMTNGTSLHPYYSPSVAQLIQPPQVAPGLHKGNSSAVGASSANQEASVQAMFNHSSKPAMSDYKLLMPKLSEIGNPGPSFVMDPIINADYRPLHTSLPSKILCRDTTVPQLQLDMSHCGQSSSSGMSS